jgi:uncharacterized protein YcbK (DUF882 family)
MTDHPARRHFLRHTTRLAAVAVAGWPLAGRARAAASDSRRLLLAHTHTGEHVDLVYADGAQHRPDALDALNRFLRDHYSGAVGVIDPSLLDLVWDVQQTLGHRGEVQIISGYRSPQTNERLRTSRGGGVARHSLHMDGRAVDVRLPGVPLAELRDAARALQAGGVGYYADENFVHLDTGRVRTW